MAADPSLFDDLGDRECHRCGAVRPLQEFAASLRANGSVKFGSYCPPCRKAYQREWYLNNRERCLAAAAARKERERAARSPTPPPLVRRPLREALGFRRHDNPRSQGDAGLGIAIAYFSRVGVRVGIPLTDSQPYDLMVDNGGELSRVQVRTTTCKRGNFYFVSLKTVGANTTGVVTRLFDKAAYEWLFVVCGDATAFLIPTEAIDARHSIQLGRKYEPYRLED
jgi:hypothetical protein